VELGASGNQVDSEGQIVKARRTYKDGGKSQIERSCRVFRGKRCIILVKANPRPVPSLRNTAPVANTAVRAFLGHRVLHMRLWIADV